MKQIIYQVDAFTDRVFSGNPAAVCVLPSAREEPWMQALAQEMNLSETAFLHPEKDGYRLRWFTPKAEVTLCGHATLASAHVLWETGALDPRATARFHTLSGLLTADRREGEIELNFPAKKVEACDAPDGLLSALGVTAKFVGRSALDYLAEIESAAQVRQIAPDFAGLARLPVRGVIVTAVSDRPEFDFISRFFAPAVGVNEDPVTGSAHCSLGPHWQERLGKAEFQAHQASARGGQMRVTVDGERVRLAGRAVTVFRAELW